MSSFHRIDGQIPLTLDGPAGFPLNLIALTPDETVPDPDVQLVSARGAGLHLIQQFNQLRRTGDRTMHDTQPVTQDIGLTLTRQLLQ